MNLSHFVSLARESWKENNPSLFGELCISGRLDEVLQDAAERTCLEMTELEEAGFNTQEAWEMTRERYLLIPAEDATDQKENRGASLFNEVIALHNKILRNEEFGDD